LWGVSKWRGGGAGEGDGFPKREPRLNVLAAAEGRGTRLINHRIIACINAESIPSYFLFSFPFSLQTRVSYAYIIHWHPQPPLYPPHTQPLTGPSALDRQPAAGTRLDKTRHDSTRLDSLLDMIQGTKRWLRRNRANFAIGAGVLGAGYLAGQYALTKFNESRQRMADERISKEK
jgi:hypothetical protein